jgi:hypothetical protein
MFYMIPFITSTFSCKQHSLVSISDVDAERNSERRIKDFNKTSFVKDSVLQFPLFNINSDFFRTTFYLQNYCLFAKSCRLSCVRLSSDVKPRIVNKNRLNYEFFEYKWANLQCMFFEKLYAYIRWCDNITGKWTRSSYGLKFRSIQI